MSDNEMNGVSVVDQQSDDESMKIVDKSAKIVKNDADVDDDSDVDNDHSSSTNNGFGADGEPDYKPRKDSSSSSESSDEEPEPISASSESKKSESVSEPPKPKSRSTSLNQSIEDKKAESSDTEDESVDLPQDGAGAAAVAPVPVARKTSVTHAHDVDDAESDADENDDVDIRALPAKTHDHEEELTRDEIELSKRETVHLEEAPLAVAKAPLVVEDDDDEISEADDEERQKSESESVSEDEGPVKEAAAPQTNGGSHHEAARRESSSSSSSEDEQPEAKVEVVERRALHVEQPAPVLNEDQRTPSPNAAKSGDVTKAYIAALNNNNNNNNGNATNDHDPVSKSERPTKSIKDISQMYVENISKSTPPASPKPVARAKPAKDITQLYTGKFEQGLAASPSAVDKISPKKHNMSTSIDKDEIRRAYDDVRSDSSGTEWAVFKFDGNSLKVTATGNDFTEFKAQFGNDDRGFGYIRIKTGDEMSKRSKFVFVTWVGPTVSVMKKAKMSTDKALMKDIIQNLSVELQLESHAEFSHDYFKTQVDKAAGARYGTGVRDL